MEPLISARVDAVVKQLITDNVVGSVLPWLVKAFAVPGVVDTGIGQIVAEWTADMEKAGLL